MYRNRILSIVLLAVLALFPFQTSHAGGWASVEIVDGPDFLEAGEPMTLALVIKQHGMTPVDVDPLVITATIPETGESFQETAVKAEGDGNYSVTLIFPSEGIWNLEGTPGGFAPFAMGPVKVGQSVGGTSLSAPAGAVIVDITGGMGAGAFEPATIEILAGTLVVWTNNSVEGHTVVIDGKTESSGLIGPGAAFALRFDEPGTYRFVCGPHPNMKGEIVVT